IAFESAPRAEARRSGLQRPAVLAVAPPQPKLHPERLKALLSIEEDLLERGPVVGVHRIEPARAQAVRRRKAGELIPAARQENAAAVGRRKPDHERRVVGHLTESCLALAERGLGEPSLGDLLDDGRGAGDRAVHADREEILLPCARLAGPRRRLASHLDAEPWLAGLEDLAPLEVQ